eukprot:3623912-Pleurochrysis_carterae.AAC.1
MRASGCVRVDVCEWMRASGCVQIDACEWLPSLLLIFAFKLLGSCFTDEKSSGTLRVKASADPARFAILAASIENDREEEALVRSSCTLTLDMHTGTSTHAPARMHLHACTCTHTLVRMLSQAPPPLLLRAAPPPSSSLSLSPSSSAPPSLT